MICRSVRPAGAAGPDNCAGPEVFTGSSDRLDEVAGVAVNVLRPPGYESSGLRYPVPYLLSGYPPAHGEDTWLTQSRLLEVAGSRAGTRGALVVMTTGYFGSGAVVTLGARARRSNESLRLRDGIGPPEP